MAFLDQRRQVNLKHTQLGLSRRSHSGVLQSSAGRTLDQSLAGNHSAHQFAQSCPLRLPNPSTCPFGGMCHKCPAPKVQTKLKIGQADDEFEREADRVAEQVIRMPAPIRQVGASGVGHLSDRPIQRACVTCEEELRRQPLDGEGEEILQTGDNVGKTPQVPTNAANKIKALQGKGRPLHASARDYFEPRFGYDLSRVRVHTDSKAAEAADSVHAIAFALGNDVVFGAGQYSPGTSAGRRLIAHELTHVVQQDNDPVAIVMGNYASDIIPPRRGDHHERSQFHARPLAAKKILGISRVSHKLLSRISIRDCDAAATPPQDPQEVQAAHDRALDMLNQATRLSNAPGPPSDVTTAVHDYFGLTLPPNTSLERLHWDRVLSNLNRMTPPYNQTYQCGPQSGRRCGSGDTAWTVFRIHLCHPWWTNFTDVNKRAAILIHEWVHASGIMWSRRRDIYCWQPEYSALTSGQRIDLPDAYMQYIYKLYTGNNFCWT